MVPKRQFRLMFGKQYKDGLALAVIVGLKCVEPRGLVADTAVSDQPFC